MIYTGDALTVLKTLESESVDCVITSPPYFGLRDYGMDGQIGLEETPEAFVESLVQVFREVKRVLKKEGTVWLNLGDSYNGNGPSGGGYSDKSTLSGFTNPNTKGRQMAAINRSKDRSTKRWGGGQNKVSSLKQKDLIGIPWRVAFALQADGWYLRQDIIWAKPNPMPESVTDRCTKSHEYIFLLSKSPKYYFDNEAIQERTVTQDTVVRDRDTTKLSNVPGRSKMGGLVENNYERRNKRSVWTVTTKPFAEAHFATFPETLVEPMILAGCPEQGTVLDPFFGAGTTGVVAKKLNRRYVGIELNPEYVELAERRLDGVTNNLFAAV